MILETKAHALPMGFLDPETMSLSTITCDKSYVVDYMTKALKQLVKKDCIMFAHDTSDQWCDEKSLVHVTKFPISA